MSGARYVPDEFYQREAKTVDTCPRASEPYAFVFECSVCSWRVRRSSKNSLSSLKRGHEHPASIQVERDPLDLGDAEAAQEAEA